MNFSPHNSQSHLDCHYLSKLKDPLSDTTEERKKMPTRVRMFQQTSTSTSTSSRNKRIAEVGGEELRKEVDYLKLKIKCLQAKKRLDEHVRNKQVELEANRAKTLAIEREDRIKELETETQLLEREAMTGNRRCVDLSTKIHELEQEVEAARVACSICKDNNANWVLTRCGHKLCCDDCFPKAQEEIEPNVCPYCRARMDVTSRVAFVRLSH